MSPDTLQQVKSITSLTDKQPANPDALKRCTQLQHIREVLQRDPEVYLAGEISHPTGNIDVIQWVDIIVAPLKSKYEPKKLNYFMDNLIIETPRKSQQEASWEGVGTDFKVGKILFEEEIGRFTRSVNEYTTTSEPEALTEVGLSIGKVSSEIENALKRLTCISVYPDSRIAQIVADYETEVKGGNIKLNPASDDLMYGIPTELIIKCK